MTERDTTRLPKWARDLIADRDRNIDRLTARVAVLEHLTAGGTAPGDVDTNVWIRYRDIPLPKDSHVRFYAPDDESFTVGLDGDGRLAVNGSRAFLVAPEASNHVRFEFQPFKGRRM